MRKMFLVIAIIGIIALPVFAEGFNDAAGTVDSIDPIDPARGDYDGGIVLRDTASSVKSFDVNTATVISDQVVGRISSGDIQDGDKVKVIYSESDQGPVAVTILRLSADGAVEAPAVVDAGNKICPVMGDKVSGKDYYDYNGKRYGLCCPMCPATFAKDPAKYAAIADKEVRGK